MISRMGLSSLVLASANQFKLAEYRNLLGLPDLRSVSADVEEPQSLDLQHLVEAKIRRVQNLVSPPFFVEHTGLFISGWNDFPGGLCKDLIQQVKNAGLCRMLSSYDRTERTARMAVMIGYYHPSHGLRTFLGETGGVIAQTPRGDRGFGWDPIFVPDGADRAYGEMSAEEKNRTSARRRAADHFRAFLKQTYSGRNGVGPTQVFVSYSHFDEQWFGKLRTMLAPMIRNESIALWSDREISSGQAWKTEIDGALKRAKVAVLLVSPNFLASDFIMREELPHLLGAARNKQVQIVWILLSACLHEQTPLAKYEPAHRPLRPLDSLSPSALNEVLVEIAENIQQAASQKNGIRRP